MSPGDFFQLGKITRTHGVKGHLVVHLDAQHPSHYKKSKEMFLMMNNVLQKFTVKEISITGNTARVLFNEIDSLTKAEDYKKIDVYLPLTELPKLGKNDFYYHELIGMEISDVKLGWIGTIKDMIDMPAQPLAQVFVKDKEVLIPIIKDFVEEYNKQEKKLIMKLPEGLLEIYLNSK